MSGLPFGNWNRNESNSSFGPLSWMLPKIQATPRNTILVQSAPIWKITTTASLYSRIRTNSGNANSRLMRKSKAGHNQMPDHVRRRKGWILPAVLMTAAAYLYVNLFRWPRIPYLLGGDQVFFWTDA